MAIQDFRTILSIIVALFFQTLVFSQSPTNSAPIHVVVQELIAQNGGKTNELPAFKGPQSALREVKKDGEGAQLIFNGNQMEALEAMLKGAYGEPVYVRTNSAGKTMFQYRKDQIGAGLSCTRQGVGDKASTHMVILGPKGLAAISGKAGDGDSTSEPASADELRARKTAIKAAVDRGYSGELDAIATNVKRGWLVGVFQKSKGPFSGSVGTVALDNDFRVVAFEKAE